ncbi:hypothetical protein Tco_1359358 [Tanacetum coccineum]
MGLGILVISAYVHAKTSVFDFNSVDETEDPFFVYGKYLSGPLRSFISFVCQNTVPIPFLESDLTITKLRVYVLERGASPIAISNGTSPMDQERSPENPTRGVFRSTLVALMASRLTISMGASAGAVPLSFLLSPCGVSNDFVLSIYSFHEYLDISRDCDNCALSSYVSLIRKKFCWGTIFPIGLKRYRDLKEEPIEKDPLMELKEIG